MNKLLEGALAKTTSQGAYLRKAREDAMLLLDKALHLGISSVVELYRSEVQGNITEDRAIIEQEVNIMPLPLPLPSPPLLYIACFTLLFFLIVFSSFVLLCYFIFKLNVISYIFSLYIYITVSKVAVVV